MAFVGPVWNIYGYRPEGVFCDACNTNLLVWRCFNCGGVSCGRSIFQHRDVPGVTIADIDMDRVSANEVAEGMHCLWRRIFERLSSEMASDPAIANEGYCRYFVCR